MILLAALRKELLEQWRSYRLVVTAVVLTAMGMASPLLAKLTPELIKLLPNGDQLAALVPAPTLLDAVAQHAKNLSQFGVILALLLGMGTVAQERERGTAVLMLVKPLPRSLFLFAKFLAVASTFLVSITLAAVGSYYYTLFLFEPPDAVLWVALNLLLWLYLLVYVAVTILAGAVLRSQAAVGGLGFFVLVLLTTLGGLPGVGQYLPGQLVAWGPTLFSDASTVYWPAVAVSLGLVVGCLLAAWQIFERQEL